MVLNPRTPEPAPSEPPRGEEERLREIVGAFVDDFGRNGSKTGREDYRRWIPLDRIEELRAALQRPTGDL